MFFTSEEQRVRVTETKDARTGREGLSKNDASRLDLLIEDLRQTKGKPYDRGWEHLGPVRQDFKRYGKTALHCHLTRKKVVKWRILEDTPGSGTVTVQLYYVGKREGAY